MLAPINKLKKNPTGAHLQPLKQVKSLSHKITTSRVQARRMFTITDASVLNVLTVIRASITIKAARSIVKCHVLNATSRQSCTRHTIETLLTASEGEGFRQSCGMCFFITGFYSVVFQHHTPLLNLGQCVPPTLAVLSAAGLHIFNSWVVAGKTASFCLSS